jgi:hypothetical protein
VELIDTVGGRAEIRLSLRLGDFIEILWLLENSIGENYPAAR